MSSNVHKSKQSMLHISLRKPFDTLLLWCNKYATNKSFLLFHTIGSGLLLALALLYVGWHANKVYANVQDATIYPYLFKNFHLHDVILPGDHSNILKFPLFWLQSVLPYNFVTFSIVNLSLLFATVFGWCVLIACVFGKQWLPILFIFMTAILLGSTTLSSNLLETTIRNIEYPIGLSFILTTGKLLYGTSLHSSRKVAVITVITLFALSFAGDSFMLYAFILPVALTVGLGWLHGNSWNRHSTIVAGVVAIVTISGIAVRHLIPSLGLATYYLTSNLQTKIIPMKSFGPSLAHASSQVPYLMGGNIFGLPVKPSNALYFINFALLLTGIAGLGIVLRWTFATYNTPSSMPHDIKRFTLGTLAISACVTFGAYILSGLAVTLLSNGTYVDASNVRYLTLLPFLLATFATFVLTRHPLWLPSMSYVVGGIFMLAILLSVGPIRSSSIGEANFAEASQYDIRDTLSILKSQHVTQIVAGDAIAAPIRFWSHDQIQFGPLLGCKEYEFQNTRLSWRQPSAQPISTALVIDRVGTDRAFLGLCSDDKLRRIFGPPSMVVIPARYKSQPTLFEVWIYHHDIRRSLQP